MLKHETCRGNRIVFCFFYFLFILFTCLLIVCACFVDGELQVLKHETCWGNLIIFICVIIFLYLQK